MNEVQTLWNEVIDHHFIIERDGNDLVLEPTPYSKKLPEALVHSLKTHKPELLSLLRFQEQADGLLLESSRRLAQAWPQGFDLDDDPRWQQTEDDLHAVYFTEDLDRLRTVINKRQTLAISLFETYRKEKAA